jgi:hypothetical protein
MINQKFSQQNKEPHIIYVWNHFIIQVTMRECQKIRKLDL